jgi:hypothetical protein
MTILGAIGAMLAVVQGSLPSDVSVYVKISLAAVSAGLSYYLGQTNQGTSVAATEKSVANSTIIKP